MHLLGAFLVRGVTAFVAPWRPVLLHFLLRFFKYSSIAIRICAATGAPVLSVNVCNARNWSTAIHISNRRFGRFSIPVIIRIYTHYVNCAQLSDTSARLSQMDSQLRGAGPNVNLYDPKWARNANRCLTASLRSSPSLLLMARGR